MANTIEAYTAKESPVFEEGYVNFYDLFNTETTPQFNFVYKNVDGKMFTSKSRVIDFVRVFFDIIYKDERSLYVKFNKFVEFDETFPTRNTALATLVENMLIAQFDEDNYPITEREKGLCVFELTNSCTRPNCDFLPEHELSEEIRKRDPMRALGLAINRVHFINQKKKKQKLERGAMPNKNKIKLVELFTVARMQDDFNRDISQFEDEAQTVIPESVKADIKLKLNHLINLKDRIISEFTSDVGPITVLKRLRCPDIKNEDQRSSYYRTIYGVLVGYITQIVADPPMADIKYSDELRKMYNELIHIQISENTRVNETFIKFLQNEMLIDEIYKVGKHFLKELLFLAGWHNNHNLYLQYAFPLAGQRPDRKEAKKYERFRDLPTTKCYGGRAYSFNSTKVKELFNLTFDIETMSNNITKLEKKREKIQTSGQKNLKKREQLSKDIKEKQEKRKLAIGKKEALITEYFLDTVADGESGLVSGGESMASSVTDNEDIEDSDYVPPFKVKKTKAERVAAEIRHAQRHQSSAK